MVTFSETRNTKFKMDRDRKVAQGFKGDSGRGSQSFEDGECRDGCPWQGVSEGNNSNPEGKR